MKSFLLKPCNIIITAIIILALSLSLLDFADFSWRNNIISYIGLILFIVLLLYGLIFIKKKSRNKT